MVIQQEVVTGMKKRVSIVVIISLLSIIFSSVFRDAVTVNKKDQENLKKPTGNESHQREVIVNSIGMKFRRIPAGSFMMGAVPGDSDADEDEKPCHRVEITKEFWMSETEVTVGQYKQFCRAMGRSMPPVPEIKGEQLNPSWSWEDHPITMVTWDDAVAYCRWVGGRLPTEAEWEYAARGGEDGWLYVWGNDKTPIVDGISQANIADQSAKQEYSDWTVSGSYDDGYKWTSPVGSFAPNGFGLFDMAGNVWDWCADWYGRDYYNNSPGRDPQGPSLGEYRVLRGASWVDSDPRAVRLSNRNRRYTPVSRDYCNGFRVVRDVK